MGVVITKCKTLSREYRQHSSQPANTETYFFNITDQLHGFVLFPKASCKQILEVLISTLHELIGDITPFTNIDNSNL